MDRTTWEIKLRGADAICDRIVVINHGTVIAEGDGYCEITPKDPQDLPAMAAALGSLLSDEHRLEQTTDSGRITLPARDGADTLVEALRRLGSANIELVDVVLRRPTLDDVFFALTNESATRTGDPAAAAVTP